METELRLLKFCFHLKIILAQAPTVQTQSSACIYQIHAKVFTDLQSSKACFFDFFYLFR